METLTNQIDQLKPRLNYCYEADQYKAELEGRFWNNGGNHIAVVAVVTTGIDWAAYIGTDAPNSLSKLDTLKYVSERGNKLSEEDARYFFPEVSLPYRY